MPKVSNSKVSGIKPKVVKRKLSSPKKKAESKMSWKVSSADFKKIVKIVSRLKIMADKQDYPLNTMSCSMSLVACHCNGMRLNLTKLLKADGLTFCHDVLGICRHTNRTTGKIEDCFVPRCAI